MDFDEQILPSHESAMWQPVKIKAVCASVMEFYDTARIL